MIRKKKRRSAGGLGLNKLERLSAKPADAVTRAMQGGEEPIIHAADYFTPIGTTGLWRFGGLVQEEFQEELRMLRQRMHKFREMYDNHPVVHAVISGIEMSLRQVRFHVQTASDKDRELGDFIEGALDDMAFTFPDSLSQIMTMLIYGFSLFELVYKIRQGQQGKASSRYKDGYVGWERWMPLAQDSLQMGSEWIFGETGDILGFHQLAPPDWQLRTLSMKKCLHFRTTISKNNPEGMSLLRAMHLPWYFSKNLAEVEGIAAERLGTGLPVMYLGSDTKKSGANSDLELAKQIVRDVRADDQSGVVLPFAKMGQGAKEGQGALLELMSPPARGFINFTEVIDRYDKRIAMAGLAQFLILGMSQHGSYALSKDHHDFFVMAISAWADMIAAELTRHGIQRLLDINDFETEDMPELVHNDIAVPDLTEFSNYLNTLVQNKLLVPDNTLEEHLRELAHLPPKDEDALTVTELQDKAEPSAVEDKKPGPTEKASESFADLRSAIGGAKYETATNNYQQDLEGFYQDWAENISAKLIKEKDQTRRELILSAALLLLGQGLKDLGRKSLLGGFQLGAGEGLISPDGYAKFSELISRNEGFIDNSLLPAIQAKALEGLKDPLLLVGGATALNGVFTSMLGRVANYAGTFWNVIHLGIGEQLSQKDLQALGEPSAEEAPLRVMRKLDPRADHCTTCPPKEKIYDSWEAMVAEAGIPGDGSDECFGNCRCLVLIETVPMSGNFERMSERLEAEQVDSFPDKSGGLNESFENSNHLPAGSSEGGQFGPAAGGDSMPEIRQGSLQYHVSLEKGSIIKAPRVGSGVNPKQDAAVLDKLGEIAPKTTYDPKRNVLVQEPVKGRFATEEETTGRVRDEIIRRGFRPVGLRPHDVIIAPNGKFKVIDVGHFEEIK